MTVTCVWEERDSRGNFGGRGAKKERVRESLVGGKTSILCAPNSRGAAGVAL